MSIIFHLPVFYQGANWQCWWLAPQTILSTGPHENPALLNTMRNRVGPAQWDDWTANQANTGLPLNQIPIVYRQLDLVRIPLFQVRHLQALEIQTFCGYLEGLLRVYGPLVWIHQADGADAVHADAVVGITHITPTREHPTGFVIWRHNTMTGRLEGYDADTFYLHVTDPNFRLQAASFYPPNTPLHSPNFEELFWYNRAYTPGSIPQRDLTPYGCIDVAPAQQPRGNSWDCGGCWPRRRGGYQPI